MKNFIQTIFLISIFLLAPFSYAKDYYLLKVSLAKQEIEVFHNKRLIKTLPCSTAIKPGGTPTGKFKTYMHQEKESWREEGGTEISYYYITRFNKNFGFHSMIEGDHPLVEEGKKLFEERKPSSMGCVRLKKEDAKWIYDLPLGAKVKISE